jgi:hypothetical protein
MGLEGLTRRLSLTDRGILSNPVETTAQNSQFHRATAS